MLSVGLASTFSSQRGRAFEMSELGQPPEIPLSGPVKRSVRGSRLGWWLHLIILGAYPLFMAALSTFGDGGQSEAALSPSLPQLALVVVTELGLFGVWFAVAWFFSAASSGQLMLMWRNRGLTPLFGFGYSVALRMGVGVVTLLTLLAIAGASGEDLSSLAERVRPDIDKVVDTDELEADPVYLIVNCTVVSFVMAGFREELWRVGMIAGFFVLFPRLDQSVLGRLVTISVVALLFGLGHSVQGGGAVMMTAVLGMGLGAIIVFHRSIWEAVLAHGFFDASSFFMIFLVKRYYPEALALF